MRLLTKITPVLVLMAALSAWPEARAQVTAEMPFAVKGFERPNVMFFVDNTAYMHANIGKGKDAERAVEIFNRVVAGDMYQVIYSGQKVYLPHDKDEVDATGTREPGENFLFDDVADAMPPVYTLVKNVNLEYEPQAGGEYFVFYGPDDAALGDTVLELSKTSFDAYMRLHQSSYIKLVEANADVVLEDGTRIQRNLWIDSNSFDYDKTFRQALIGYWDYEETGLVTGGTAMMPTEDIVPVYHVPADKQDDSTPDPSGKTSSGFINGLCYMSVTGGRGASATWFPCYKPGAYSTSFVWLDDLDPAYRAAAEEITTNTTSFPEWYYAYQANEGAAPDAYCPAADSPEEVWGDRAYSAWLFDWKDRPLSDGNRTDVPIYQACLASDPGAIPIGTTGDTVATIKAEILAAIPFAEVVDAYGGNTIDNEFLFRETSCPQCERLDLHVRRTCCSPPLAEPADSDFSIDDPWFGGFFCVQPGSPCPEKVDWLAYDGAWAGTPGVMDEFPDVNYGLMGIDYINQTTRSPMNPSGYGDDMPPDYTDKGYGMDVAFNPSSWADFPAYRNVLFEGFNANFVNDQIQEFIREHFEAENSNSPLASAIHDCYRYFFNVEMDYGGHGGDITYTNDTNDHDSMFFDLKFDAPSGVEDRHIIQGDPYYINECRRNYIIMTTPGRQGGSGEGDHPNCSGYGGDRLEQCVAIQWIEALKTGGGTVPFNKRELLGVKTFLVGFADDFQDSMREWLEKVALATDMDESWVDLDSYVDDNDIIEEEDSPDPFDDFFEARNETQLRENLTLIMNAIMKGQVARADPTITLQVGGNTIEMIFVASYFEVGGVDLLWRGHMQAIKMLLEGDTATSMYWDPFDAATLLNNGNTPPTSQRKIFTALPDNSGELVKEDVVDTNWDALDEELDPEHDRAIYMAGDTAQAIINFMRGEGPYISGKEHEWLLGPINHSRAVIIGGPAKQLYLGESDYRSFAQKYQNRLELIYVGTMFGTLGVFNLHPDAGPDNYMGGQELFQYMPRGMLRHQYLLWQGTQIYGLDQTPFIFDAQEDFDGNGTKWATVLVSGAGGGSTSVFAAEITEVGWEDPSSGGITTHSAFRPMWNFSHRNLGFTWSRPVAAPLLTAGDARHWRVFFGGGTREEPLKQEVQDQGGFFYMLDLVDGTTVRTVFEIPEHGQLKNLSDLNDLQMPDDIEGDVNYNQITAEPVLFDKNNDALLDWIYIGDLDGQMWKINVTDPDPDNWTYCLFYDVTDEDADGTRDISAWRKPLWYRPEIGIGPDNEVLIYFLTGHAEIKEYADDETHVNHLFGVMDDDGLGQCTYAEPIPTSLAGNQGLWPVEFSAGEKPITEPLLYGQEIVFKTFHPNPAEACDPGTIRGYGVDFLTGEVVWTVTTKSASGYVETPRGLMDVDFGENPGELTINPIQAPPSMPSEMGHGIMWGEDTFDEFELVPYE